MERTPSRGCWNHHQIRTSFRPDWMFNSSFPLTREKWGGGEKNQIRRKDVVWIKTRTKDKVKLEREKKRSVYTARC